MTHPHTTVASTAAAPVARPPGLEDVLALPGGSPAPPGNIPARPGGSTAPATDDSRPGPHPTAPAHRGPATPAPSARQPAATPAAGMPAPGEPADPEALRLLTADQAADLLQIPASWLRKKAAAGLIHHTRIGRHLRFSASDLQHLIHHGHRAVRDPSR
ncbi:helix-turn-helix domain-containing protein [Streptomyces sp. NPDC102360]|uniref:helix-turn-helix domain-containing protein n=1 Tax=Streptomyces sp. NPDC102360 TaxID=3366160 RepID=UPI0037FC88E3